MHIKLDFVGDVSWFLGQRYNWHINVDGTVSYHILQQAFIEGLLEKFNMDQCKKARSPYQSGLKIDLIEHDSVNLNQKRKLLHNF